VSSLVERHRSTLIGIVIVAGVAGLLFGEGGGGGGLAAGSEAPSFRLPVLGSDARVSNEDLAGQPAVLDFWATWCGPCRATLPGLDALAGKYAGRARFYAVNASNEPAGRVAEFVNDQRLKLPVLLDGQAAFARFGGRVLPTTVVLDGAGRVVATFTGGEVRESNIARALDELP
jgi:thiol-disulfide isomerase/thioredoxin